MSSATELQILQCLLSLAEQHLAHTDSVRSLVELYEQRCAILSLEVNLLAHVAATEDPEERLEASRQARQSVAANHEREARIAASLRQQVLRTVAARDQAEAQLASARELLEAALRAASAADV